ncbi:MAG: ATP-dependent helicase, partial [Planctomycetota bacterium]
VPAAPVGAARAGDVLAGLDPEQRAAAEIVRGPLAIVAGPGTGKTRTLTHRIAHLVLACGAAPEECLAIAFTRRAAEELAERLHGLLGDRARGVPVHTFHSLGLSILREEHALAGLSGPPRVAGERERSEIVSEALGCSAREARRILERISRAKRSGGEGADPETAAALAAYDARLRERGLADFDDLIALPVRILEASEEAARKHRARYRWISVDEFQDIDPLQYRLLRLLAAPDGNVCAIGDPDQSIYAFRGADAGCFRRFFEDFPGAATVALSRSYRLSRAVAEASLDVVARESLVPGRRLVPSSGGAERIEIRECASERAEAEMVVHAIEKAIGGSTFFSMDSGRVASGEGEELSFGDFAVLYRMRAQAEPLVEAFARSGIPFQERAHRPLAEVPAVEALLAAMEGLARREEDPASPEAILERAREGFGEKAPALDPYLPALRSIARRRAGDLRGFLADAALSTEADLFDPRAEAVSLLTLHAAKGLEFRAVFIVGCEDGILPLSFDGEAGDLAEERRLLFVGMTRARERLVLSWAKRRVLRARAEARRPSPFLEDIRKELLERARAGRARKPKPPHRQLTIFDDA